ncbi:MAG: crosslink repair DNA glycosylase YcaQ family protein [Sphingorhabdus sp.]
MSQTLKISNRDARKLWLNTQGLANVPTGALDVLQIIRNLGFVQLDTIRNVTRAHHHILWSRNQNYREPMLGKLLAEERSIFEHFTHDASVLPMEFYPMWKRQFRRLGERVRQSASYRKTMKTGGVAAIKARIEEEGPLSTHAFDTKITGKKQMWDRPPHKRALDTMWYAGELATSHRENFTKYYDLSERIIPSKLIDANHSYDEQIDWLCRAALARLGFGTPGEIQRFWGALSAKETKTWAASAAMDLIPVEIECADGKWTSAFASNTIEAALADAQTPTSRLRIINPFDPAIRDRERLARLFGFAYRIEIFVPAAERKWGYYVYPLLEGDRFVGRIEVKADRKEGILRVIQFWSEPGVRWTGNRSRKLGAELERFAQLIGAGDVQGLDPAT